MELLIYIGISAIAIVILTNFLANTTANAGQSRQSQELQQSARFIFNRLSQEVRQATSIGTTTSPVTLTTGSDVFSYDSAAKTLTLTSSSFSPATQSLTPSSIAVDQFTLTPVGSGVTIGLQVSLRNANPAQSLQVSTTLIPARSLYQ